MQTIIDHYNHQIPLILKNRDQYRNDLRDITNNEQYIYFCSILQNIADSDIEYSDKNKEKKLNILLENKLKIIRRILATTFKFWIYRNAISNK